jgi:hypothetical protein
VPAPFDRERLQRAFELLGQDLADRNAFIELAVYGGGAVMMQFEWRRSTEDVDAVVRAGSDEALLALSVRRVAERLDLDADWLNNAVGMFTPLHEDDSLFQLSGTFPAGERPALRILLATPHYLLAMKLHALSSLDRGDRDMDDARKLAQHLGLVDENELRELYQSIYDEAPPIDASTRFASVLGR